MSFVDTIDIETDESLIMLSPALVMTEDRIMDWEGARDLVRPRRDHGYIMGNYCQLGPGDISSANKNGNVFADEDTDHTLIPRTPLNMLHQRRHVVGTFVGAERLDPRTMTDKAMPPDKMPFPFIESLAVEWRHHFADEWKAIVKAFDQGLAYLSMEATADALKCLSAGCCDSNTYPYKGLRSDTYCDSLNLPRAKKRLVVPHFVGGGMIIPPAMPGWRNADITHIAAAQEAHPDIAELVYDDMADAHSHLSPKQWEFLMAVVLSDAFAQPSDKPFDFSQDTVDRMFAMIVETDFGGDHRDDDAAGMNMNTGTGNDAPMNIASPQPQAAGVAVVAADTGKVLMLQRSDSDPEDPAAGTWEFPGGCCEEGESGWDAAQREWSEETGCDFPDGELAGTWLSPNGVYQGFVYVVASKADVPCNMDPENRNVLNPDDPDGDDIEVAAWFDPGDLPDMPALREECRQSTPWPLVNAAAGAEMDDQSLDIQIPPDRVNYRGSGSFTANCGECCYFMAGGGGCQIVAGPIQPDMICDLFTPETAAEDNEPDNDPDDKPAPASSAAN